jgi:hypothetical protein
MSINVKIINDDSRPKAIIRVKVVDQDTGNDIEGGYKNIELIGGEQVTRLIHSGTKIIIEEIQNG